MHPGQLKVGVGISWHRFDSDSEVNDSILNQLSMQHFFVYISMQDLTW